jgi:hypothetical protein
MKTEKDVKINKIFDKLSNRSHMRVVNKYIISSSWVISTIRSWENEIITIYYLDSSVLLGVEFKFDDVISVNEEDDILTIKLSDETSLEFK